MQVLHPSLHFVHVSCIAVLAFVADWLYQGVQVMQMVHKDLHVLSWPCTHPAGTVWRQDMSCRHLAHHELESVSIDIVTTIIIVVVIIIITIVYAADNQAALCR